MDPELIPGPFPPPTRRFHEMKLPADKRFRQLTGWGEHVLLLADEGLFEHDGTRIVRKIELCLEAQRVIPGPFPQSPRRFHESRLPAR